MNTLDPLQPFRQPLVTAIGLVLGFSLGFLADWVTDPDFAITDNADYFIILSFAIVCISMIMSLYRILKIDYPKEHFKKYYSRTLRIFIFGLGLGFTCLAFSFFLAIL